MSTTGTPTRFCGGCGAPLTPGTAFCGHCGRPVPGAAPAAPAAPSPEPAGSTAPAQAPAAAAGRRSRRRVPVHVKLTAAVGVLVLLGIAIKVLSGGSPCTFSCEPHFGPPIPDAHTYTASSLGISFGYPDGPDDKWTQVSSSDMTPGALVAFQNRADGALFEIFAGTGDQSPDSLVQKAASQLEGNFGLSQVSKMGPIFGAEIGFSPGTGEFYSATGQAQDGSPLPMVVGVVAAQHQGTWATFIGLTPQNQHDTYTGMQDGNSFDDVLARWSWPGS